MFVVNTRHAWVELGTSGGRYRARCSLCHKHSRQFPVKAPAQECIEAVREVALWAGTQAAFEWVDAQTDLPGLSQHEEPLEGLRQWVALSSNNPYTLERIRERARVLLRDAPYLKQTQPDPEEF